MFLSQVPLVSTPATEVISGCIVGTTNFASQLLIECVGDAIENLQAVISQLSVLGVQV